MIQYLPFIGKTLGRIFGSKEKRDEANAKINTSIHSQFASEFGHNRNLFDSVIDGINRLPRPVFVIHILVLFDLCWFKPEVFAEGAQNLDLIPTEMWAILSIIITFYFGDRVIKGWGKHKVREHIAKNYKKPVDPLKTESDPIKKSMELARGADWDDLN